MKILLFFFFCFIAAAVPFDDDGVLGFYGTDVLETIKAGKYVLVLFYTPEKLAQSPYSSEYSRVASLIKETYPSVKVCKTDISFTPEFKDTYNFLEEPTLSLFIKGVIDPIHYQNEENADNILHWLESEISNSITHAATIKEADDVVYKNYIVGFYLGSDPDNQRNFFNFVTKADPDIKFLKSSVGSVMHEYDASEDTFIFFTDYGRENGTLTGDFRVENLERFVKVYREPAIRPWEAGTINKFERAILDAVFFIRNNHFDNSEEEKQFRLVAEYYRGNISFVIMGQTDQLGNKILKIFDYNEESLPAIGIYIGSDHRRIYRSAESFTDRNMRVFLANYFADNLVEHTKPNHLPNREYDGNVMVVDASIYNEIVMDETRDVLIEWYSPHCGGCIAYAPTYSDIADTLEDVKDLIVAKIDVIANRVEGVEIRQYPTIMFYARGKKNTPEIRGGGKPKQEIIELIQQHGTVKID